jgi:chemotaxis protein histidine kinase CheA
MPNVRMVSVEYIAVVVDKHGGTLTFETELGKGTSFRVRLPLATADTAELAPIR